MRKHPKKTKVLHHKSSFPYSLHPRNIAFLALIFGKKNKPSFKK